MKHTPLAFPTPVAEGLSGRYEVSTTLGRSTSYRTDSLDSAMLQHEMFTRANAANRDALFSIYDFQTRKTIEAWRGGKPHGPVDALHPMERMIRRARLAGQKTFVGGF
jgi:hypothetical protein